MKRALWLAGLMTMAAPVMARAQTAAATPPPSIRVGATIFADYTVTESPKITDANGDRVTGHAFNVVRSYINVTGNVTRRVTFRITPDIARVADGNLAGSQLFRLKYAYFDVAVGGDTSLRFGMQQTPFIDGQEGVYRYRFQGTVFAERDGGMSSSDVGLTVRSRFGSWGEFHGGVYNGEGYSRPEVNDQKALMARVAVRPAPGHAVARGLRLVGYLHVDDYVQGAPRNRAIAAAMFEHARFNAGFDWLQRTDQPTPAAVESTGRGYSFFVTPFLDEKGRGWEGLLRIDRFTPNVDAEGSWNRIIAGAAYWFPREGNASAALLANFEQVKYSNFAPVRPTERRIGLYALINF